MSMKKTAIIVLPLVLLFMGASCTTTDRTATPLNVPVLNTALTNTEEAVNTSIGAEKTYTSMSMGLSFQYPNSWEIASEDENIVRFLRTDNQLMKDGTSAQDPNGISVTISLSTSELSATDHALALQRTKGTYSTAEQQRTEEDSRADSSFPQRKLASTTQVTIGGKSGYAYAVQVEPTSEERPIMELSNYYDGMEYYIPVSDNTVLIVRSTVGYGKDHDALVSEVAKAVETIQFQK